MTDIMNALLVPEMLHVHFNLLWTLRIRGSSNCFSIIFYLFSANVSAFIRFTIFYFLPSGSLVWPTVTSAAGAAT